MDYKDSTKKTSVAFTGISGDFTYKNSYNYDTEGNITGLVSQVTKTADGLFIGSMNVSDNGQQNTSLVNGADLSTHAVNFETIVAKIKADVATAIATTASSTTSETSEAAAS